MASLGCDSGKRGATYRVLLRSPSGKRHTIRLGRVSKKIAETARRMIESLESAKAAGHSPDRETAEWVGRVSDEIHERLFRAGLVPRREHTGHGAITLGQHLEQYFGTLGKQKPNTARNYARARRLLEEHFGKDRTLDSITEGDADSFRRWLLDRYAPASASVDLRRARQFLKAAVRRRLITTNPFADVPCGPQANDERIVFVPAETIERVIAICPDEDWRMIFALPRFGGVRFPSEVEDLKWSDIDWVNNRFTVHEKKLEHHPGRGRRVVPIFEALRPHLERAYRERAPGAVYVVPRARHGSNLATHAKRLVKRPASSPGRNSSPTFAAAAPTTSSGAAWPRRRSTRGSATRPICGGGTTTRCGRRTGRPSPEIRHQFRHHQEPSASIRSRQTFMNPAKKRRRG